MLIYWRRNLATLGKQFPLRVFLRFAANGGGIALVAVATYGLCATVLRWAPLAANLFAYLVQLALGYNIHRIYSFARSNADRASIIRYLIMSLAAFGLNSFWIWLLTGIFDLPTLTPIIPMVCVTPLMTFFVARQWVFRGR